MRAGIPGGGRERQARSAAIPRISDKEGSEPAPQDVHGTHRHFLLCRISPKIASCPQLLTGILHPVLHFRLIPFARPTAPDHRLDGLRGRGPLGWASWPQAPSPDFTPGSPMLGTSPRPQEALICGDRQCNRPNPPEILLLELARRTLARRGGPPKRSLYLLAILAPPAVTLAYQVGGEVGVRVGGGYDAPYTNRASTTARPMPTRACNTAGRPTAPASSLPGAGARPSTRMITAAPRPDGIACSGPGRCQWHPSTLHTEQPDLHDYSFPLAPLHLRRRPHRRPGSATLSWSARATTSSPTARRSPTSAPSPTVVASSNRPAPADRLVRQIARLLQSSCAASACAPWSPAASPWPGWPWRVAITAQRLS